MLSYPTGLLSSACLVILRSQLQIPPYTMAQFIVTAAGPVTSLTLLFIMHLCIQLLLTRPPKEMQDIMSGVM